jgi:2-oxoglutarate dehydrogenase E2 component (dihydrolipoamide succinyltransferase)
MHFDLQDSSKKKVKPEAKEPVSSTSQQSAPELAKTKPGQRSERRVKMTRLRSRVAERLKGAQNTCGVLCCPCLHLL